MAALTITHTPAEGTLIDGTARRDNSRTDPREHRLALVPLPTPGTACAAACATYPGAAVPAGLGFDRGPMTLLTHARRKSNGVTDILRRGTR